MENVCVIFGGMSCEHQVSCVSASYVCENLDKSKYNLYKIGITKSGEWKLYDGDEDKMRDGTWCNGNLPTCVLSPDRRHKGLLCGSEIIPIDVIFPVLHGAYGEDGCIQGLFELSGIPYVGCGVSASMLGMDKVLSKMAYATAGIPQADWIYFDDVTLLSDSEIYEKVETKFIYPVFVKPANTGSSIGVSKAHDREELLKAVSDASKIDKKVLVEEFIKGHEVECAVLGNKNPEASCVGEVKSAGEFYDYDSKYCDSSSETVIPADIPNEYSEKVRKEAVRAFRAIGGKGLSRADFFITDSGDVLVNELNTLPGFTSISMYPKLWINEGVSYSELLTKLIKLAYEAE